MAQASFYIFNYLGVQKGKTGDYQFLKTHKEYESEDHQV